MNRNISRKISMFSALVLSGAVSSAAYAGDPAPTTAPAPTAAVAAAPSPSPVARSTPRVEVFEFTPVDKTTAADWIGRGIREDLQSDVSKTGATLILPPHAASAGDDPIAAAKQDHADFAVVGTYQVVGDQVRVNAHLMDVASNTAAGGFSATGAQHDLFKIEDALGEQLRSLLPRPVSVATPALPSAQAAQPELQPAPTVVYQQSPETVYAPAQTYYQSVPDYYPDYGYGYAYGYGYPLGFYGGVGIYGGGHRGGYYNAHPAFRGNTGGFRGSVGGFHGAGGGGHGGGGRR